MRDVLASLGESWSDERFHQRNASLVKAHFISPGLPNLQNFMNFLDEALAFARRCHRIVAVLLVYPGGFPGLDGSSPQPAEEVLLQEAANRMSGLIRRSDCVARLHLEAGRCQAAASGSEAFAICLTSIKKPSDATKVARRIRRALAAPFSLGGREVSVTAATRLSLYPFDGESAEALLRAARTAGQKVAPGKNGDEVTERSRLGAVEAATQKVAVAGATQTVTAQSATQTGTAEGAENAEKTIAWCTSSPYSER